MEHTKRTAYQELPSPAEWDWSQNGDASEGLLDDPTTNCRYLPRANKVFLQETLQSKM